MLLAGLLALIFASTHPILPEPLPDRTPGIANPSVDQSNISTTICVAGFPKTVRPSSAYTNRLKRLGFAQYDYVGLRPSDFEEDHLVSIELGGHPTDPRNLWPQSWYLDDGTGHDVGARTKDRLENALHKLVCSGRLQLSDAQQAIAGDWIGAYRQYVGELPAYRKPKPKPAKRK